MHIFLIQKNNLCVNGTYYEPAWRFCMKRVCACIYFEMVQLHKGKKQREKKSTQRLLRHLNLHWLVWQFATCPDTHSEIWPAVWLNAAVSWPISFSVFSYLPLQWVYTPPVRLTSEVSLWLLWRKAEKEAASMIMLAISRWAEYSHVLFLPPWPVKTKHDIFSQSEVFPWWWQHTQNVCFIILHPYPWFQIKTKQKRNVFMGIIWNFTAQPSVFTPFINVIIWNGSSFVSSCESVGFQHKFTSLQL